MAYTGLSAHTLESMKVVGLDLSLTSSGVAVWAEGTWATFADGFRGKKGDTPLVRNPRIATLADTVLSHIPSNSFIVIEGPAYKAISTSDWDRAGLWHMVVRGCTEQGCSVSVTPPVNAKMWMTGHAGAGKPLMTACAEELIHREISTNDEADAVAFASMGLHHLGITQYPELFRHKALTGVEWASTVPLQEETAH